MVQSTYVPRSTYVHCSVLQPGTMSICILRMTLKHILNVQNIVYGSNFRNSRGTNNGLNIIKKTSYFIMCSTPLTRIKHLNRVNTFTAVVCRPTVVCPNLN